MNLRCWQGAATGEERGGAARGVTGSEAVRGEVSRLYGAVTPLTSGPDLTASDRGERSWVSAGNGPGVELRQRHQYWTVTKLPVSTGNTAVA